MYYGNSCCAVALAKMCAGSRLNTSHFVIYWEVELTL